MSFVGSDESGIVKEKQFELASDDLLFDWVVGCHLRAQITELKAAQFRMEQEHRTKLKTVQKEHEAKVDVMQERIRKLQKEVAALNKNKNLNGGGKASGQQQQVASNGGSTSSSAAGNTTPMPGKSRGSGSDSDSPSTS